MKDKLPTLNIPINENPINRLLDRNRALTATYELYKIIYESLDFDVMTQKIANLIPQKLGYEVGILALIDDERKYLTKVTLSETIGGVTASKSLEMPFDKIRIPLDYETNLCVKALKNKRTYLNKSFYQVFEPTISRRNADAVQKKMGTKINIISPLFAHEKPIGVFVVCMSKGEEYLSVFEKEMIEKFAEGIGVALESSKLYSELKTAKEELHIAYENLQEQDKLKDEFISITSHELRTPMTIVDGYLWMLANGKAGELNENQKEYLKKASGGTKRMLDLIHDMLNISRIEQGRIEFKLELTNIASEIEKAIKGFGTGIKQKGIYLKFNPTKEPVFAYADKTKLNEVILNLVENAIKFTAVGGVDISIEENDDVKVKIKDTGAGIDKKNLERLFRKFGRLDRSYQTSTAGGGTGLGLYIVKKYIEGMEGSVGAFSEGLNLGSTFWFTLPKANKITP